MTLSAEEQAVEDLLDARMEAALAARRKPRFQKGGKVCLTFRDGTVEIELAVPWVELWEAIDFVRLANDSAAFRGQEVSE